MMVNGYQSKICAPARAETESKRKPSQHRKLLKDLTEPQHNRKTNLTNNSNGGDSLKGVVAYEGEDYEGSFGVFEGLQEKRQGNSKDCGSFTANHNQDETETPKGRSDKRVHHNT